MLLECQNVLLLLFVLYLFIYSGRLVGDVSFRRIFLTSFISIFWLVMWVWKGFFLFFLFSFILIFRLVMWVSEGFFLFFYFFLSSGWWCECQKWSRSHRSTGSCVWPDVWKKENASEIHFCQVWKYFEVLIYANTLIHGALCFNLERLSSVFVF